MRAPADDTSTRTEQADLDKLAGELSARGFQVQLVAPPSMRPYLTVRNPQAAVMTEQIYAHADAFFWSWREPLAGRDQIATAADSITRVLRVQQ